MSKPQTDQERAQESWLHDTATLKLAWVWWLVLFANMGVFAWGLREVDRYTIVPLSCVWLGAFSCCMIFHAESVKRILALRAEVKELRRTLEERTESRS